MVFVMGSSVLETTEFAPSSTERPSMALDLSPSDDHDEVLTPDEVAAMLKVSKKTVLRQARLGDLPAGKVGRAWRFRRSELLEFLTSGTT